jgi:hypothetical protein
VAQVGSVWFSNKLGAVVNTPFFDDHGVRLEGPDYAAQLYGWKFGYGFLPVCEPSLFKTNGYFDGRTVLVPWSMDKNSAWMQVRAWKVDGDGTFEAAALAGAWTGVADVLFLPLLGTPFSDHCPFRFPGAEPEPAGQGAELLGPPVGPARLIGLKYPSLPLIVRQPQAQTVRSGETAVLSVIASSGVAASYQWHQQPSGRPDGLISGRTNATYTTTPLLTHTTFWASISNSAGTVESERATVTVLPGAPRLDLRIVSGLTGLVIDAPVGPTYRIETTTDFGASNWTRLVELLLPSRPFTYVDLQATNAPVRFYRARVVP